MELSNHRGGGFYELFLHLLLHFLIAYFRTDCLVIFGETKRRKEGGGQYRSKLEGTARNS